MKINWGVGILIAMLAFIGFITYFSVKATIDEKYNHQLVAEDYYRQEIEYQKVIDLEKQTQKEGMQVAIWYEKGEGIVLTFPEKVTENQVKGRVILYRPSNKNLDFQLPIMLENRKMIIPDQKLVTGRWDLEVNYQFENKQYKTSFKKIDY